MTEPRRGALRGAGGSGIIAVLRFNDWLVTVDFQKIDGIFWKYHDSFRCITD
jgi:hypothetical protein